MLGSMLFIEKKLGPFIRPAVIILLAAGLAASNPLYANLYALLELTFNQIPTSEEARLVDFGKNEWYEYRTAWDKDVHQSIGIYGLYGTNSGFSPDDYYRKVLPQLGWAEDGVSPGGNPYFCHLTYPNITFMAYDLPIQDYPDLPERIRGKFEKVVAFNVSWSRPPDGPSQKTCGKHDVGE